MDVYRTEHYVLLLHTVVYINKKELSVHLTNRSILFLENEQALSDLVKALEEYHKPVTLESFAGEAQEPVVNNYHYHYDLGQAIQPPYKITYGNHSTYIRNTEVTAVDAFDLLKAINNG